MNENLSLKRGFYFTLFTSILIISITLITEFQKTLFVHESGNFTLFGVIGSVLAIGLLLKWRYVRTILIVFTLLSIPFEIMVLSNLAKEFLIPHIVLLIVLIIILSLLVFSKSLKYY